MNRPLFPVLVIALLVATALWPSCKKDKLPEPAANAACDTLMPTYQNAIKAILDAKCAVPGCHTPGFSSGDFSTYESVLPRIGNGSFRRRALDQRDMPPAGSPQLTEEELLLIECWLEAGYPK